jgi:hypothetical protein
VVLNRFSAHTIAVVALIFAMASAAGAATVALAPGSVGTPQLKNGAVSLPKLSKKLNDLLVGLAVLSVRANKAPTVVRADGNSAPGSTNAPTTSGATASCPSGQQAFGGGVMLGDPSEQRLSSSYPSYQAQGGWTVIVVNTGASAPPYTAYAICH